MDLRTAFANIHRDRLWWRKILIGGALMLTVVGYPWAVGLVMESMDNTRKGFPTPLPPWRDWSTRYVIGLFAVLIDVLFFGMPVFLGGLIFLCFGTLLISSSEAATTSLLAVSGGLLALYELVIFALGLAPIARLIFADAGHIEDALGARPLREALRPGARSIYARARALTLPAYIPFALLLLATMSVGGPAGIILLWLALSALLYAHLIVAQVYVAAERELPFE